MWRNYFHIILVHVSKCITIPASSSLFLFINLPAEFHKFISKLKRNTLAAWDTQNHSQPSKILWNTYFDIPSPFQTSVNIIVTFSTHATLETPQPELPFEEKPVEKFKVNEPTCNKDYSIKLKEYERGFSFCVKLSNKDDEPDVAPKIAFDSQPGGSQYELGNYLFIVYMRYAVAIESHPSGGTRLGKVLNLPPQNHISPSITPHKKFWWSHWKLIKPLPPLQIW